MNKTLFAILPMAFVAFVLMNDVCGNETFHGTIIETTETQVIIRDQRTGESRCFVVEPATGIYLDSVPVNISELHTGIEANVVAESEGSFWFAIRIEATSAYVTFDPLVSAPV